MINIKLKDSKGFREERNFFLHKESKREIEEGEVQAAEFTNTCTVDSRGLFRRYFSRTGDDH